MQVQKGDNWQMEYENAWEVYKCQQKYVKFLIHRERVKHERQKFDELRRKGEEGGKDWTSFCKVRVEVFV